MHSMDNAFRHLSKTHCEHAAQCICCRLRHRLADVLCPQHSLQCRQRVVQRLTPQQRRQRGRVVDAHCPTNS